MLYGGNALDIHVDFDRDHVAERAKAVKEHKSCRGASVVNSGKLTITSRAVGYICGVGKKLTKAYKSRFCVRSIE